MPKQQTNRSGKTFRILFICFLIIAASAVGLWLWAGRPARQQPTAIDSGPPAPPAPAAVTDTLIKKRPPAVIGKETIDAQADLKDLMAERKARFGVDKGVDFITAPDESIQVGGITVPMSEILDKIRLKRGAIIEKDIVAADDLETDRPVELYGIYVVRPNDNIWNIHFNFLKDLFNHKGIALSPLADEPIGNGQSSGIGKLLKFSENMVAIYNIRERRLDANLDRITPDTKVVVFNFTKVFDLLDQIDFHNLNHIQFDGETIWIPAMQ